MRFTAPPTESETERNLKECYQISQKYKDKVNTVNREVTNLDPNTFQNNSLEHSANVASIHSAYVAPSARLLPPPFLRLVQTDGLNDVMIALTSLMTS